MTIPRLGAVRRMARLLSLQEIAPKIYEAEVEAPEIARKAKAGQYIVVMPEEIGERIPLTLADWSAERGTITLIFMVVGTSSMKLSKLEPGADLFALAGPLGHPSVVRPYGTAVMVGGGVGTAPIYPIARALREAGNRIVSIQGARTKDLLFWEDRLASVSDEHIVCTDDGSTGRKALVTEPLKEILASEAGKAVGIVYAIGPAIMMKFASKTTEPFGVHTVVSLNPIMIDATGMCGGCRVTVGDATKFACVDGPEFDGHLVDWDTLIKRQRTYEPEERCSLDRYLEGVARHG